MTARGSVYRVVDAATIRAAAHSWPDSPIPWPNLCDVAALRNWLRATWGQPGLSDAVWIASPEFAARVGAACSGGNLDAERARRMALALARYLARAQRRATPFGLFSGVAALRFDAVASVTTFGQAAIRVQADAGWVAPVVALLEADPLVRKHLRVQANNMAVVHGDRIVVKRRPHLSAPAQGTASVRNTKAVRLLVSFAAIPVGWDELVGKVAEAFPRFPRTSAEALIADLVSHGVLISSLRPPSTCRDPVRHILDQRDVTAEASRGGRRTVQDELSWIHGHLDVTPNSATDLRRLAEKMLGLTAIPQPLAVDLQLADRVVLPHPVATEIVASVDVLRRLTPDPAGRPQWRAYRARFVNRYGTAAVVPLAHLLNPVTGLGYPEHFDATADSSSATSLSGRDGRLLALAQQALIDGAGEVVLDDAAVQALAGADENEGHLSAHVDVLAEVRAASVAALDSGEFTVALTGMGRSAMATGGRFLNALPDTERERMCKEFGRLPVAVEGAMLAQLSFPPSNLHAQNVLNTRQVLPWLVSLAEHRPVTDDAIGIDDLGVAVGRDRLVLVSLSQRRVVEPTVAHAAALHTMPLLGRFLVELPRGMDARLKPFDWGAASGLPFRPALRYGRTLLTAARWRIDPAGLPAAQTSDGEWLTAWELVRAKLRLPVWVQIGNGDQRLRLNLDQPMDRALLRAHLDASDGPITLVESAQPADFGWLSGRAHEIVVPVASTAAPAAVPAALIGRDSWPPPAPAEPLLPGTGGLISVSLAVDPSLMELVLSAALPALIADWDEPPLMWFIRMRRPAPHLRLRLHTDDFGYAAVRIGRWAAALRQQGLAGDLSLDTYHPESGRYGDGPALAAAERLFVADSTAALAQLRAERECRIDRQAFTAASMVDLAAAMLGNRNDGCEWLIARLEQAGRSPIDRDMLRQAVAFDPAALPGPVRNAWRERSDAAARYADALSASSGPITPESVLASLLHLHHVRTHGPDEAAEQVTYRLARHIALATVRRRTRRVGAP